MPAKVKLKGTFMYYTNFPYPTPPPTFVPPNRQSHKSETVDFKCVSRVVFD